MLFCSLLMLVSALALDVARAENVARAEGPRAALDGARAGEVVKVKAPKKFITRIIDGTAVARTSIPVVQININTSQGQFLCSGTMVAQDVVLTARHCVTNRASDHVVNLKGRRYGVSRVRIHPSAREVSNGSIIYDIALLYLRRNPKSNYFPIITSRSAQPGDSIYIYGYGLDENGDTQRLKAGRMTVARTSSRWVFANFTGDGDSNTCEGDSGGPAFGSYQDSNGIEYLGLVGATAGGYREDCGVGDESYFTNLQSSTALNFLRRNIRSLARR